MSEEVTMSDPHNHHLPAHRAADADREATAQHLRDAAADGRLSLSELEERLEAAFSAKTFGELEAITVDLAPHETLPRAADSSPLNLQTRSGVLKKQGYWRVPAHIHAECTSGVIKLDFTEADCPHREVTVEVTAKSGSVSIIVPRGWAVDLDQATAKSGTITNRVRERPAPNAPVLRVSGTVLSGTIKARYPRRSFWAWLTGRSPS